MTGACAVLAGALLVLAPGWAAAQPAETADVPRTPWGQPDLGGVWVNGTTTPLERPESFGDREFLREGEAEELPRQLFTDRLGPLTAQERALAVDQILLVVVSNSLVARNIEGLPEKRME